MIQRIQSIFLLLSSASFWSLFALPFATSNKASGQIYNNMALDINDHIGLLILAILGGIVALGAIFLFNNRKLQSNLASLVALLALVTIGFVGWLYFTAQSISPALATTFGIGSAMPVVSFITGLLANFSIKKDDKLVKSMDRLR